MRYMARICENCGVKFGAMIKYVNQGGAKYCSRSCTASSSNRKRKGTYHTKPRYGADNPAWKGGVSKDNMRYKLRFESKSPEKVAAHKAVHKAIRLGSITRQPCINCGSFDRIHAHHEDYSRPLDVKWLCQQCHIQHHARGGVPL